MVAIKKKAVNSRKFTKTNRTCGKQRIATIKLSLNCLKLCTTYFLMLAHVRKSS